MKDSERAKLTELEAAEYATAKEVEYTQHSVTEARKALKRAQTAYKRAQADVSRYKGKIGYGQA